MSKVHIRKLLFSLFGILAASSAALMAGDVTLTDAEIQSDDGSDALRVRVLDAEGGKEISTFRVILGVDIKIGLEKEFIERHPGKQVVNWQPHTTKIGSNGVWERSMRKMYNPLALRVEAEGYLSTRYLWIDKKRGSQEIVFKLAKDDGIEGKAILPNGQPAVGAKVGVALVQRNLRIEGTSFFGFGEPEAKKPGDRWRRPTMVVADAKGKFKLPTETDPACVLVVLHEQGIAEMFYADFVADRNIKLKKWGRVEGKVVVGNGPGENVEVTFGTHRHGYGYPGMVAQYVTTKTDKAGKFVIEKAPPGLAQISLFEFFPKAPEGARGFGRVARPPESAFTHVTVKDGKVTNVELGGPTLNRPGKFKIEIEKGKPTE